MKRLLLNLTRNVTVTINGHMITRTDNDIWYIDGAYMLLDYALYALTPDESA